MMSGMTVGLLKEILIKHDLSDDDVIDFDFTDREIQLSREIEFEGLYKKHNKGEGIIIEFEPTELEEISDKEKQQDEHLSHEENWRAGYDVLTEGALGDYPEE